MRSIADDCHLEVANSIVWDNGPNVIESSPFVIPSSISFSYSLVEGLDPLGAGNLDGTNVANTPQFVGPSDLRLLLGSPGIDVGNWDSATPLDLSGNPREIGTIDMGAYELAPVYVDASATGLATGTSWTHAFTDLQEAVPSAARGQFILVAEGTYYPDEGGGMTDNDRTATFTFPTGVLFGGYPKGGGARDPLSR